MAFPIERPPAILRYGTAVIAVVFLIAAAALAWWLRDTLWQLPRDLR